MTTKTYNSFFLNFANATRFNILMSLIGGPLNVTQITNRVNEEQSKISHNLKKLEECHLLNVKQKGKQRIYSLNDKTVIPMIDLIKNHVKNYCKECDKREV
ncbi:winged helix-turn-helix transcriptional regulator [Candidatus Woesearchaeota archaeon]|nr:winged helix-turn-helix transcriptional regulator [Candidatus Woesearchaeota archaeon]